MHVAFCVIAFLGTVFSGGTKSDGSEIGGSKFRHRSFESQAGHFFSHTGIAFFGPVSGEAFFRLVPILVFILCCLGDTKIFAMVCNRWLG